MIAQLDKQGQDAEAINEGLFTDLLDMALTLSRLHKVVSSARTPRHKATPVKVVTRNIQDCKN